MKRLPSTILILLASLVTGLRAGPLEDFLSPEVSHRVALHRFKQLPPNLSEPQVRACFEFLRTHYSHRTEEPMLTRQNDIADRLLRQDSAARRTIGILLTIIEDEEADILWREYCLQKLPEAYQAAKDSQELRQLILATLRAHLHSTEISLPGTSLLGLYRLREQAQIDSAEISAEARRIATEPSLAESNRLTALQIAVLLDDAEALDLARQLLRGPAASIPLRISAIASIGLKGDLGDRPLIRGYTRSSDYRLRTAAQAALQRMPSE